MNRDYLVSLLKRLISIPSVTSKESDVLSFIVKECNDYGWSVEKIPVSNDRYNIFITFGKPHICFSTHVDVVPAGPELFEPKIKNDTIFGRGACDAKGIVASIICAARILISEGHSNFSILFVVGEETDGIGAKTAAKKLKDRGIKYLVNGEPTECKLVSAHKGGIAFEIFIDGISSHSGYPELGDDANKKLVFIADKILKTDFGENPEIGKATVNLGKIIGGSAANVVSDHAEIHGMIRTVTESESVIEILKNIVPEYARLNISNNAPLVKLKELPGFELMTVSFATDIPHFLPLGAENLLYGPGSIHLAHTENESITIRELEEGVQGYCRIYHQLSS